MGASLIAPGLLLSIVLSVGYASLFHFWRGRSLRDLLLFLIVSAVGFGAGQLVGTLIRVPLLQVGEIHLLEASLGAIVALSVAQVFTNAAARRT